TSANSAGWATEKPTPSSAASTRIAATESSASASEAATPPRADDAASRAPRSARGGGAPRLGDRPGDQDPPRLVAVDDLAGERSQQHHRGPQADHQPGDGEAGVGHRAQMQCQRNPEQE